MTHFHLMRTQKHKILSIVVLNMAKYTMLSLILTDFVAIFFIFSLFWQIFRGSFHFKKVPSSKKSKVQSEKLLGVVINNVLTWKNHLYDDNEGLVSQLSKRIGMMKKMSRYMSKQNLKYFASGIYYYKLNYCLPVFGNVFGLDEYKQGWSKCNTVINTLWKTLVYQWK